MKTLNMNVSLYTVTNFTLFALRCLADGIFLISKMSEGNFG